MVSARRPSDRRAVGLDFFSSLFSRADKFVPEFGFAPAAARSGFFAD
jgi:hypothetical protein